MYQPSVPNLPTEIGSFLIVSVICNIDNGSLNSNAKCLKERIDVKDFNPSSFDSVTALFLGKLIAALRAYEAGIRKPAPNKKSTYRALLKVLPILVECEKFHDREVALRTRKNTSAELIRRLPGNLSL